MAAKHSTLTAERVRELLDYCPETGIFKWRIERGGRARAGSIAGTVRVTGHIRIIIDQRRYYAHRLAVFYVTGEWPTGEVDHKSGDASDNAWDNLRDVPPAINKQNLRRAKGQNKCGFLGVSWSKSNRGWIAWIGVSGRHLYLGTHPTPELAHAAYLEAKRRLHPGNTL